MGLNWLDKFIAARIVKRAAKEIEMSGWKTKLGGIAVILGGAAFALNGLLAGDINGVIQGIVAAGGGLGAIGLGHKLDKNTDAVKGAVLPSPRS